MANSQRGRLALAALILLAMSACGGGGGGKGGGGSSVTVSGTLSYQFVPPATNCSGLDFLATESRPIRAATVQLLDDAGGVIATTTAGDDGRYAFANLPVDTMVQVRVRAELKRQGSPGWDVEIRDNYDASAAPPPLDSRPLYVLDSGLFSTGSSDRVRDLTALTGWGGNSYTAPRAAAPFAILDTIYTGMQFILTADAAASFPSLDVFWSVNNTGGFFGSIDLGQVGSSSYLVGRQQMLLLGDAFGDTEEFDDHVVLHEWGHYFEDAFSRSDSKGGAHSVGESLESSLAFGEGWGHAIAAMATGNPIYCDTGTPGTGNGFFLQTEAGNYGVPGWFNEWGVATVLYDLWDSGGNEPGDDGSIGFGPIYDVLTGPQASTEAFTSMFSFATELRASLDAQGQAFLDAQLARENIIAGAGLDIWATNETNDAGVLQDVFPLYTDYTADGSIINICVNSQLDGLDRDGNNIGQDRYLRITVPLTDEYDVVMAATTPTPVTPDPTDRDQSDPDFYIYTSGQEIARGVSATDNLETVRTPVMQAGTTYTMFLEEWRFEDRDGAPTSYPSRMCFDVSFAPTP